MGYSLTRFLNGDAVRPVAMEMSGSEEHLIVLPDNYAIHIGRDAKRAHDLSLIIELGIRAWKDGDRP